MKTIDMRFWHYTPAVRLPHILSSGKINLDKQARAYGEKPAAWISTNPKWEYTVLKAMTDGLLMDYDELNQKLGLGRIEIKPSINFISWNKFRLTSGINKKLWLKMTEYGIEKGGCPDEWYASYITIIRRYFLSVEMNIEGKWVKCKDLDKIERFVFEGMEANRTFVKKKLTGLLEKRVA